MPDFATVTREDLVVGDYIAGHDGSVWKVTRAAWKDDGRYLGVEQPGSAPVIVKADQTPVTRITYGAPTEEQAVATVAELLGGKVLATHDGPSWFHPPHSAFEADEELLRAHLVRFHAAADDPSIDMAGELRHGDLLVIHHNAHAVGSDHEHGE